MTIYEADTGLEPAEVVRRAERYFAGIVSPDAAWVLDRGPSHIRLHREVGEIVIGAMRNGGSTHVRASASRGAATVAGFLGSLAPTAGVREVRHRFTRGR